MISAKCYTDGNHDFYLLVKGKYNYNQALEEVKAGSKSSYIGHFDFDDKFWEVVCHEGETCRWITDMDIRVHVNLIDRELLIDFLNDNWENRR